MTATPAARRHLDDFARGVVERRAARERALRGRRFDARQPTRRPEPSADALALSAEAERRAYARALAAAGWLTWEIELVTGLTSKPPAT